MPMFYRPAGLPACRPAGLPACRPAGLVPAGLVPAGLVPAGLVPAGLVPAGIEHCAVQHRGREGRALAVSVRVAPTNNFFLSGHQRKPNPYSPHIGQIGNLDTAFAAVV